ncbi:hypothetical protein MFIFM68171_02672 [Madurella fahalii]|uniref:Fatty acid desaturase n=1 Tax=Madurella fahalii TaxID=1157608 RepID=A0ABQ0G3Z7_9PEZI
MEDIIFSPELTVPDTVVLHNLADDIRRHRETNTRAKTNHDEGYSSNGSAVQKPDVETPAISASLTALNDPKSPDFEPSVISSLDFGELRSRLPTALYEYVVVPYVTWARSIVRHETDVIMLTHLILYFITSLPSAFWLYYHFTYLHGVMHFVMQFWYMGTYMLMMHQRIHMNGILAKKPVLQLKGPESDAAKAAFWELSNYTALYTLSCLSSRATAFVFLCPLLLLRIGLMVDNWGQHAFVDADESDSYFRSSITLIDVPSNHYCYNDGYHTSNHLNPRRHWRHHPVSFLQQKEVYAAEKALVFHNIDYLMITVKLLKRTTFTWRNVWCRLVTRLT